MLRLLQGRTDGESSPNESRQDLSEHLSELRYRLMRAALYVVLGMILMYALFPSLFLFISEPILKALHEVAMTRPPAERQFIGAMVFHSFTEMSFLRLKLSLIAGLVVAVPFMTFEIWGFVLPALTTVERRFARMIAPLAATLFIIGAALAFFIMPAAVHWFLTYLADFPNAVLLQDPQEYILFLVRMMLAFGLVFELPVVMLGLGKLGIIRSSMLTKYWRYIVVVITTLAMIVVPSNDPFSMIVMAVPMVILFFISIWLVKLVEPKTTVEKPS